MQDLSQNTSRVLPLVVVGRYDATHFLKWSQQFFYASLARRRLRTGQEFLGDNGAEIDARSICLIKLSDDGKRCSALDEVNVKVGVDQVFRH